MSNPDKIKVKVKDGDIYCKEDPHRMKHHKQKMIQWYSNDTEFVIEFLNGSPFVTGETELVSKDMETSELAVKHPGENGMDAYVYEVSKQSSPGQPLKADPGLIVWP